MISSKRQRFDSKDLGRNYRSWVMRRLVTLLIVAAVLIGGMRLLAMSGQEWAGKYDLVGYLLEAFGQDAAGNDDASAESAEDPGAGDQAPGTS